MSRLSAPVAPADLASLDVESMPGHYIRRLQQIAVRLFAESGVDMTPVQFAALVAIARRKGMGQAELAAGIGYDRATIGGVIDRLEARGWVSRTASREDRRQNLLAVTREGERALAQAIPAVQAAQQAILAPLDASERSRFESLCRTLAAAPPGTESPCP